MTQKPDPFTGRKPRPAMTLAWTAQRRNTMKTNLIAPGLFTDPKVRDGHDSGPHLTALTGRKSNKSSITVVQACVQARRHRTDLTPACA